MARPSTITIGLTALLAAILGVGVWLIARPRLPPPPPAAPEPALEAEERPRPPPPPRPAPTPPAIRRAPARLPAAAPAPVASAQVPPPAPAGPETGDAGTAVPPAMRREVLTRNHNLRLAEADEEIFVTLNLPEATRARVREINDQHRKRTEQSLVPGSEPPPTGGTVALTASEARQVALRQLMGNDGAQQFITEERAAIRKLRGKYRFEWGKQLRE